MGKTSGRKMADLPPSMQQPQQTMADQHQTHLQHTPTLNSHMQTTQQSNPSTQPIHQDVMHSRPPPGPEYVTVEDVPIHPDRVSELYEQYEFEEDIQKKEKKHKKKKQRLELPDDDDSFLPPHPMDYMDTGQEGRKVTKGGKVTKSVGTSNDKMKHTSQNRAPMTHVSSGAKPNEGMKHISQNTAQLYIPDDNQGPTPPFSSETPTSKNNERTIQLHGHQAVEYVGIESENNFSPMTHSYNQQYPQFRQQQQSSNDPTAYHVTGARAISVQPSLGSLPEANLVQPNHHNQAVFDAIPTHPETDFNNQNVHSQQNQIPFQNQQPYPHSTKAEPIPEIPQTPWWRRNQKLVISGIVLLVAIIAVSVGAVVAAQSKNSSEIPNVVSIITEAPTTSPVNPVTWKPPISSPSNPTPTGTGAPSTQIPIEEVNTPPTPKFTPRPTTSPTRSFAPSSTPCARFIGPLFESDCPKYCFAQGALDTSSGNGGTAVITTNKESIQFYSIANTLPNEQFQLINSLKIEYDVSHIAISGNVVIVGASYEDDGTGAVYVFEKRSDLEGGQWTQTAHIVPESAIGQKFRFGSHLSLEGDVFIAGAPYGARAYIYRRSGVGSDWELEATLPTENHNSVRFGSVVSIQGDVAAVGDPKLSEAYVYRYEGSTGSWVRMGNPLRNEDCNWMFGNGVALAIDDSIVVENVPLSLQTCLLVSCERDDAYSGGALFYYEPPVAASSGELSSGNGGDFVLQQKFVASDKLVGGGAADEFGTQKKLSVDGKLMVVGTNNFEDAVAYVYRLVERQWVEVGKIRAPAGSSAFGQKISLSGSMVLLSANSNVYAYSLEEC